MAAAGMSAEQRAIPGTSSSAPHSNTVLSLHRTRLVNWKPSSVTALAAVPVGTLVAVGYDSGDLELWETSHFVCVMRVPGDGVEITSLAWVPAPQTDAPAPPPGAPHMAAAWRLYCSRLDGNIAELDMSQLRMAALTDCQGGAVWCLRSAPSHPPGSKTGDRAAWMPPVGHMAAACDDGGLRLFTAASGQRGCDFRRLLFRAAGRLLAMAWHHDGARLAAAGSTGTIHDIDVATGRELLNISVGASPGREVCVWTLAVLHDRTLVSGDSDGAVQFWEGGCGTLLQRFQKHDADVLTLVASSSRVYAAGVDSRLAVFHKVAAATSAQPPAAATELAAAAGQEAVKAHQWVFLDYKRCHSHDVHALALVKPGGATPLLVSAGLDAQIIAYRLDKILETHPIRATKSPQPPLIAVAPLAAPAPLMAASQRDALEIWRLGQAPGLFEGPGPHPPSCPPKLLVQIKLQGPRPPMALATSPDGRLLAASSLDEMRLWRLDVGGDAALKDAVVIRRAAVKEAAARKNVVAMVFIPTPSPPAAAAVATTPKKKQARAAAAAAPLHDVCLVSADSCGSVSTWRWRAGPAKVAADSDDGEGSDGEEGGDLQLTVSTTVAYPRAPAAAAVPSSGAAVSSSPSAELAVSRLVASPDGRWVAAAGVLGQVVLYPLPALAPATLLTSADHLSSGAAGGGPGPLTALSFTPDSKHVVAATSDGQLLVYTHTQVGGWVAASSSGGGWPSSQRSTVQEALQALPGCVAGLSFTTGQQSPCLLAYTPGAFCVIDLDRAAEAAGGGGQQRQKRKRSRDAPSARTSDRPGCLRTVLLPEPCLALAALGPSAALLVEQHWDQVIANLTPPLYRHRYGE